MRANDLQIVPGKPDMSCKHLANLSRWCLLLILALLLPAAANMSQAQINELCFAESRYCISGRMLRFWQENGGLAVFGLPVSPVETEIDPNTGRSVLVQWFERYRFELHPENLPPYDVLLGRIGVESLAERGVDWQLLPRASGPEPGCLWFSQTQHNVCDQVPGSGFKTYWESNGLRDPALDSYGRSLALFGLPLTEAYWETTDSGGRLLVQWFERARFEWHPLNPPPYNVLLGRLGAETRAALPLASFVDGTWSGVTSEAEEISLTIADGAIQAVWSRLTIQGEGCRQSLFYVKSSFTAGGLAPIAGNTFSATIEDAEMQFTISGTFSSDALAAGTVRLTTKPGIRFTCVGSGSAEWRAARQVEQPPAQPPAPTPPAAPVLPLPTALPDTSVVPTPERRPSLPSPELCQQPPDPAQATDFPLRIVEVDKKAEVVTLENVSQETVDLTNWTLCSVTGNQVHEGISGTIEPGETRRLLHGGGTIWLNDGKDDGALYDPEGRLVSYWDDPQP